MDRREIGASYGLNMFHDYLSLWGRYGMEAEETEIRFGLLKKYVHVFDAMVNTDKYTVKFMVHDVVDSYTGQPVATICVVRNITDYDNPIDYVLVEHWQGQWLGTTLYVNIAWYNDYKYFCVLEYDDAEAFLKEVVSRLEYQRKHGRVSFHEAMIYALRKFHNKCQKPTKLDPDIIVLF